MPAAPYGDEEALSLRRWNAANHKAPTRQEAEQRFLKRRLAELG